MMQYLAHRNNEFSLTSSTTSNIQESKAKSMPAFKVDSEDEIITMGRVRQLIAERMTASSNIPQVTSFIEADVTNLVQWRNQHKVAFKEKYQLGLTYTPIFIHFVAQTLRAFPLINSLMIRDQLIKRKAINIGFAVALSDDNLVVPVILHADQLSIKEIAHRMHELVHKAHSQQLAPDELSNATYTVSSMGSFKNIMGTPLVVPPQVAILGIGTIVKKPAVVSSSKGDTIAIREQLILSHSFDHRIIDGAMGGHFIHQLALNLEAFDINTPI